MLNATCGYELCNRMTDKLEILEQEVSCSMNFLFFRTRYVLFDQIAT